MYALNLLRFGENASSLNTLLEKTKMELMSESRSVRTTIKCSTVLIGQLYLHASATSEKSNSNVKLQCSHSPQCTLKQYKDKNPA